MANLTEQERYDRQNRTYGKEATQSLINSTVVVIGLNGGLATESCKNLLLSGVKNLVLIEDGDIEASDLEAGFYFNENDIGKQRHLVLAKNLIQLNPTSNIISMTFQEIDWKNKVFILHNSSLDQAIDINRMTRENNSKFVWIRSKGVSGNVFVDSNINHIVSDLSGENIEPVQLEKITEDGKVFCAQNNSHEFQSGDTITFSNLSGLNIEFLMNKKWKIKSENRICFQLEDFIPETEFYLENGTANFIKEPVVINHQSLESQLENMSIVGFNEDFDKKVIDFYNQVETLPIDCWGEEMNNYVLKYQDKKIQKLVRSSNFELMPVISVIGSLGSMEVIKLITGKFTPINQWMVYSDPELIPDRAPSDLSVGLGSIFGQEFKDRIEKTNWLMVGCGAIGCEMLKNLAKLNFSTNEGEILVTDPDHIETSNLSRQFLFRNSHVGKSKSKTACASILEMNNDMNLQAMEDKMSSENQKLTDAIMPKTFGIINALDNIEARRYMDEQCFRYGKPLFESGTQGMKGNTQPVVPFVTETYSNSSDPPQEKSFPVCTIKNFPNQPQHTVHWAMDYFEMFKRGPENLSKYNRQKVEYLDSLSGYDKSVASLDIYNYLVKYQPKTWQDCSKWASDLYLELFRDQIIQLLHNFPQDSKNEDGELFWSKGKRCPIVLDYDLSNDLVINFIEATTHLLARTCGLNDKFSRSELLDVLSSYQVYEFVIDEDKKIAKNDNELKDESKDEKIYEIPTNHARYVAIPQEFEKDDDSNWHVAFVTSSSNLRSENYGIPILSFDEAKGIAGKIVPAVATTTSIVSGLITMEILKYCSFHENSNWYDHKMIESYKSWFVSLSTNIMVATEPITAPMLKFGDVEINSWTRFELNHDMTLNKFLEIYQDKFKTGISMVLQGTSIIYANFMPSNNGDELISKIFKDKYGIDVFSTPSEIIISAEDDEIELPIIQVKMNRETDISI